MPTPSTPTTDTALTWVDPRQVKRKLRSGGTVVVPDLLSGVPIRRSQAGWIPVGVLLALVAAYAATTLLWPLNALPPTMKTIPVTPAAVKSPEITWPSEGYAGVGVKDGPVVVSTDEAVTLASITKVVTVLTILDHSPLAPGETGPEFHFTQQDSDNYWRYLTNDESALDVPVDGVLTEYQLIEGILLGSAGNYTDILSESIWPSDEDYAAAASDWMNRAGIIGITLVEPTGIDPRNVATPQGLLRLAEVAMQNPIVAEIVAKPSVDLPGAGLVKNTNGLIGDPGVVGLKTGSLDGYNLLSVKNLDIGGKTVQTYAVALHEEDDAARNAVSRNLYTQLDAALQPVVLVPKDTAVAEVSTAWGESTKLVTISDATGSVWQHTPTVISTPKLGSDRDAGAPAGTLSVTGTLGTDEVGVRVANDLPDPSPWWRLTHPFALFGWD